MPSRARPLSLVVLVAACVQASRAGAPPPLPGFPAVLLPADGSTAPPNARVWAFGDDAPPPAQAGVSVQVAGAPVAGNVVALGCCGVAFLPAGPFVDGAVVDALVTSPGGELGATFSVDGAPDEAPPTLEEPVVLDDGDPLVLAVQGADDRGLAGFLALARAGDVVGAAPASTVLQAPRGDAPCVDVVAVDLAGNRSDARAVCVEQPDAGPAPAPPPGGCAAAPAGAAPLPALLLVLLRARRARRAR